MTNCSYERVIFGVYQINVKIINDDLRKSTLCLTLLVCVLVMVSQSIADDVTDAMSDNNCDVKQVWWAHEKNDISLVRYWFYSRSYSRLAMEEIKDNAWVTVNNDFRHSWKLLANRITSDPKSLFTVTNVSFYLLHATWYPEHSIPPKQLSVADFAVVAKDRDVTTVDLWRHANVGH